MIKVNNEKALNFIEGGLDLGKAYNALDTLVLGNGAGAEYTGWVKLPTDYDKEEYSRIKACGKKVFENADALVVIGIGGSYLGARAVIEFILSQRYNEITRKGPKIYFVGNGINGEDLNQVLELVDGKNVYVNVISKSGTTLEPALAFRIFKKYLEETYGKEGAKERIICTTDKKKGALKSLADEEGYECFVVPDEVGGRYSVLTPVGLLPIAAAGIDIDALMEGAQDAMNYCQQKTEENPALIYAATRQALYNKGKKVEILSCPSESVRFIGEWWKQLYGESEGKDKTGIFPASCVFTADLHSMGQYIQDGERFLMETFLSFEEPMTKLMVPSTEDNADGLNYVAGKEYREVYRAAEMGVAQAHVTGDVPVMTITMPKQDTKSLGELIYFFEFACGVSAYMQGVNPFNQPGVEEYKKNMFALLGKK
ncbi:MAG: glucose-6-phosphate isomerase [Clostridia bacterium]|nr:glucose-6-phosphate isomerase [Clostridia bacterium]